MTVGRVALCSDNEPTIDLIKKRVAVLRGDLRTDVISSSLRGSRANCLAQATIRWWSVKARTLRYAMEAAYGVRVTPEHVAWPWMCRHAAFIMEKFRVRVDGSTSHAAAYGCAYCGEVLPFGEIVLWKSPVSTSGGMAHGRRRLKVDCTFAHGIWVGNADRSDDHLVLDEQSWNRCRTLRRLEPSRRHEVGLLGRMRGVPWDKRGEGTASRAEEPEQRAEDAPAGSSSHPYLSSAPAAPLPPRAAPPGLGAYYALACAPIAGEGASALRPAPTASSSSSSGPSAQAAATPIELRPASSDVKRSAPEVDDRDAEEAVRGDPQPGESVSMDPLHGSGVLAVHEEVGLSILDALVDMAMPEAEQRGLDPELVRLGKREGLAMLERYGVYEVMLRSEALASGFRLIRARWDARIAVLR